MSKFKDNNLVLIETEMIKFPSSNLYDSTASLIVTGSNNVSGDKIKGVSIDPSALSDGFALTYDSTSGTLIFSSGIPPTPPTPPVTTNRGVFGGGIHGNTTAVLDYINISSEGNAQVFGNLTMARTGMAATSNGVNDRGVFAGGAYFDPSELATDVIDYFTITTPGDANSFGVLTVARKRPAATSNGTNERGVTGGGGIGINIIDYITINSTGDAIDFGDLTEGRGALAACSNGTNERGVWAGGTGYTGTIDYVTINASPPSNALSFGNLSPFADEHRRYQVAGTSNGTNERGVFIGGDYGYPVDVIDYITINSPSNATDFGNLTHPTANGAATSSKTNERGVFGGGEQDLTGYPYTTTSDIEYITINSIGNSSNFGQLVQPVQEPDAVSNS